MPLSLIHQIDLIESKKENILKNNIFNISIEKVLNYLKAKDPN